MLSLMICKTFSKGCLFRRWHWWMLNYKSYFIKILVVLLFWFWLLNLNKMHLFGLSFILYSSSFIKLEILVGTRFLWVQKQPSRGVYKKRCYENMHQIYSRTPMPKRDFNKVARHGYFPVNLQHIFRTLLPRYTSWWLLLWIYCPLAFFFG